MTALRKGINLPADQLSGFIEILPQIERVLQAKGSQLPRPNYTTDLTKTTADGGDDADKVGETVEQDAESEVADKITHNSNSKGNHEATSDEEDED